MKQRTVLAVVAAVLIGLSASAYGHENRLSARSYYLSRARTPRSAGPVLIYTRARLDTGPRYLYDCGPSRYAFLGHGRRYCTDPITVRFSITRPDGSGFVYTPYSRMNR